MRIGILTYHRAFNYGAFLQAYALKSFLTDKGFDVSFIDYWPVDHEKMYNAWDKTVSIKSFFRNLLLARKRKARYRRFITAQQRCLGIDRKPSFRSSAQLERVEYDAVIYGSDQIWWKSRIGDNGFDPVYWGQYINGCIKKISYAASMGIIELQEKDLNDIRYYMTAFSHISVRETQLQELIQPLTDKTVSAVLDPTLLVPSSFWESICDSKNTPVKTKYILYYRMMSDDKADAFARELGRQHNLPVIMITGNIDSYKTDSINTLTDPIMFLTLIRNAEYVVSTSFHGVALSVQFRKEFYALGMKNNSDRVSSLLSKLGLEKRMVDTVPDGKTDRIDYTKVHSILAVLRRESEDFLISSLQS